MLLSDGTAYVLVMAEPYDEVNMTSEELRDLAAQLVAAADVLDGRKR